MRGSPNQGLQQIVQFIVYLFAYYVRMRGSPNQGLQQRIGTLTGRIIRGQNERKPESGIAATI